MIQSNTYPHSDPVKFPQDVASAGPQFPLEGGAAGPTVKNTDDPRPFGSTNRRTPMLIRANPSALSQKLHPIQDTDKDHVSSSYSMSSKRELDEVTGHDSILYPKKVGKTPRTSLWLNHAKRSKESSRRLAGPGAGSSFPAQNDVSGGNWNGNENSPRDATDGNPKIISGGSNGSANENNPDGNTNGDSADDNANGNGSSTNGGGNGDSNSGSTPGGGNTGGGGTKTSGGSTPNETGTSGTSTPGSETSGDSTPSSSGPGSPSGSSSGSARVSFNNFDVSSTTPSPTPSSSNPGAGGTETSGDSTPTGISGGGTSSSSGVDSSESESPSGSSSNPAKASFNNFDMSSIHTTGRPDKGNPTRPTPSSGGSSGNDNKPESTSGGQVKSNGIASNPSATNQRPGSPTPTPTRDTASYRTGFSKGHGYSEPSLHGGWTTIFSVSSFTSTRMTTMTITSGSSVFMTTSPMVTTGVTTISIATDLPENTPGHHSSTGTIAGALFGSIFGLLLIISLLICYRRKRQKQRKVGFLYLTPGPDTNFTDRLHAKTSRNTKSNLARRNISTPVLIGHGVPSAGNPADELLSRQNIEIAVMKEVQSRPKMSLPSIGLHPRQNTKPRPPPRNRADESVTETGISQPDLIWFPTETPIIEDPFDDRFQIQPSSTTATR